MNNFPDELLIEHARRFAVKQGHSICNYDRREYLQALLQNTIDGNGLRALEISPYDNPFLRGANVKYFAMEDAENLRETAIRENRPFKNFPEKIHFVSATADLSVVNETFDVVFSSHVVEHVPDLIAHFNSVAKILNAGGLYVLIVPDKRYCFDYYNAESTIFEVIEAFNNKNENAREIAILNTVNRTHNNPIIHWLGIHGERFGEGDTANVKENLFRQADKFADSTEKNEYLDAHNWQFTPDSFGYVVDMLNRLDLISLSRYRLCHTVWGRQEFIAMLEKI